MSNQLLYIVVLTASACCGSSVVSSVIAAASNSGTGDDDGGGGNTPKKYEVYPDYDFTGGDIECTSGVEASACETKCDNNDKCVSYIHTADDKLCCIKHGTQNYTHLPDRKITGYIKNIDGYEVKDVGDRPSGDIENMKPATLSQCKERCDSLNDCIGFNFKVDNCWIKKSEGISQTYSNNGYQFYTKK
jgi:hypothetical protein